MASCQSVPFASFSATGCGAQKCLHGAGGHQSAPACPAAHRLERAAAANVLSLQRTELTHYQFTGQILQNRPIAWELHGPLQGIPVAELKQNQVSRGTAKCAVPPCRGEIHPLLAESECRHPVAYKRVRSVGDDAPIVPRDIELSRVMELLGPAGAGEGHVGADHSGGCP